MIKFNVLVKNVAFGSLVISAHTFYSDDRSLNPTEVYNFCVKMLIEKTENKHKSMQGLGHF